MTIALSLIILCTVIALGKILGKGRLYGISLGGTWILFVGIVFSHFGYNLDPGLLHFLKEFGLILFVYSIGMQVGPGFFSSFRAGGVKLNVLATLLILFGAATTLAITKFTGTDGPTMVGVMSGAVTNTPGLGAAQQAFVEATGGDPSRIALGYAVAYPLGVVGCILAFVLIKLFYKNDQAAPARKEIPAAPEIQVADKLTQRKIIISKRKLNGMTLGRLEFEKYLGANIIKIRRAGIEITATPETILQLGDIVTVVGTKTSVDGMEKVLGNSLRRLDEPNLIAIFAGIALGCALGSIPIHLPGIPQPIKLGLAGGPLIVSILMGYFGPRFKIVTYTTTGANLMIREIGISLFLACVGLQAGNGFVDAIIHQGGLAWVGYGFLITFLPIMLCGLLGRTFMKVSYSTLLGVLSGASTNPPALAFAGEQDKNSDAPAVGYATVYPLSMFLRVLTAQLMILFML